MFERKNAVAWAALFVSICSLVLTIATNQRDAEYKEFSISPKLSPMVDPEQALLFVQNDGLGPALVEGMAIMYGEKCSTSFRNKNFQKDEQKMLDLFYDDVNADLDKLLPAGFREASGKQGISSLYTSIDKIVVGEYISAGKPRKFYHMDIAYGKSLENIISEYSFDPRRALKVAFAAHSDKMHFALFYCSISGKNCYFTDFPETARTKCGMQDADLRRFEFR